MVTLSTMDKKKTNLFFFNLNSKLNEIQYQIFVNLLNLLKRYAYIIMLQEWYHKTWSDIMTAYQGPHGVYHGSVPIHPWPPTYFLINGHGHFASGLTNTTLPLSTVTKIHHRSTQFSLQVEIVFNHLISSPVKRRRCGQHHYSPILNPKSMRALSISLKSQTSIWITPSSRQLS